MAEIVKGITNLVQSILQIITGTISTIVNTIVSTFQAAFSLVVGTIKSVVDVSEGLIGLVVGNLTLILALGAAYWGYIVYQQRQGNRNPQPLKELAGKVQAK